MKPNSFFRVERMENNEWYAYSYHKNIDYAKLNADVHFAAGYPCRVICNGNIVYQCVESEP